MSVANLHHVDVHQAAMFVLVLAHFVIEQTEIGGNAPVVGFEDECVGDT